ncbi:MAG: transposase [Candidatus Aminicenantes bacterium]|nr:transposase [Candidatus Aminicenantes bacterium]
MNYKRSQEDWKNEINKYLKSGLSINKYCKENSLSSSTFRYWKKKYSSQEVEKPLHLVKVTNPMKTGEKMKLSYNQVIIEFPAEYPVNKIAHLISALKEV